MSGMGPAGLEVSLGPLRLKHPLINASGTFDLFEAAEAVGRALLDDPPVAAYVPKTVTLQPRRGNEPPRIVETEMGMLNSIGLPNGGVERFVTDLLPRLVDVPRPLILNLGGFALEDYRLGAELLRLGVERLLGEGWTARVGLELNVSCPNVHSGCMSIGTDPDETRAVTAAVRSVWPGLLVVKLTPNVTDLMPIALAAADGGASALSLVNTFKGLVLDRFTLRPYLGGGTGGLSGPAIKPLALRCVYEVSGAVDLPVVGMGGVTDVQDVLDFLACGASVVAVGAAGFRDPWLPARLAKELASRCSSGDCLWRRWWAVPIVLRNSDAADRRKAVAKGPALGDNGVREQFSQHSPDSRTFTPAADGSPAAGERHPLPAGQAQGGAQAGHGQHLRRARRPPGVSPYGQGVRHHHGRSEVRPGQDHQDPGALPGQPLQDGHRSDPSPATRARRAAPGLAPPRHRPAHRHLRAFGRR